MSLMNPLPLSYELAIAICQLTMEPVGHAAINLLSDSFRSFYLLKPLLGEVLISRSGPSD